MGEDISVGLQMRTFLCYDYMSSVKFSFKVKPATGE